MARIPEPPLCAWPRIDASSWPAPQVPFPVRTPYRPRPDLFRLGALAHGRLERRPLDADRRLPAELAGKWARLRAVP
jgi:hypothetical protein